MRSVKHRQALLARVTASILIKLYFCSYDLILIFLMGPFRHATGMTAAGAMLGFCTLVSTG